MRCSQCELPLSPTRNICPRCGTPISANISNQAKAKNAPPSVNTFAPSNLPSDQTPLRSPYNQGDPAVSTEAAHLYTSPATNWSDANTFQNPDSFSTQPAQMPFSAEESSQVPFPPTQDWQSMPPSVATQQADAQATFPMGLSSPQAPYSTNNLPNRPGQPFVRQPYSSPQDRSKRTRMGFAIAGLCVMAGSFLLIFVYLVGQGFLPGSATTALSGADQLNTASANQTATAIPAPTPTIPATATPLPGQGLLETSVLASNFNEQTGQIIQEATDFKVNQKIYVVFSLHQGGNNRAACLNWYLNDQLVNQFAFDIDPASNYNYYSYTTMPTAGSGRVDISLASTKACTDAILAQKLRFTVSA